MFDLVRIFHVPLPAGYFSAFSYGFSCCVWCGLSVFWRSVVPFHPVGGVGQLACPGFLVREACIGVLVHGTGLLLSQDCFGYSRFFVYPYKL